MTLLYNIPGRHLILKPLLSRSTADFLLATVCYGRVEYHFPGQPSTVICFHCLHYDPVLSPRFLRMSPPIWTSEYYGSVLRPYTCHVPGENSRTLWFEKYICKLTLFLGEGFFVHHNNNYYRSRKVLFHLANYHHQSPGLEQPDIGTTGQPHQCLLHLSTPSAL